MEIRDVTIIGGGPTGLAAAFRAGMHEISAWGRYVGLDGEVVGIDRFGASAPYQVIFEQLGLTAEAVAEAARRALLKVK